MIRLFGYVIDSDNNCFIVGKERSRVVKDTGAVETYIAAPRYYPTLEAAIIGVKNSVQREVVAQEDMSLYEAIVKVQEINLAFAEELRGVRNG